MCARVLTWRARELVSKFVYNSVQRTQFWKTLQHNLCQNILSIRILTRKQSRQTRWWRPPRCPHGTATSRSWCRGRFPGSSSPLFSHRMHLEVVNLNALAVLLTFHSQYLHYIIIQSPNSPLVLWKCFRLTYIQESAKRWALGCVNPASGSLWPQGESSCNLGRSRVGPTF